MSLTDEASETEITVYSTLGERLLAGVQNLWSSVNQLTARSDRHDQVIEYLLVQLEQMRRDIESFRREIQSLKISRGRARARVNRLEQIARDAADQLERTRQHLTTVH